LILLLSPFIAIVLLVAAPQPDCRDWQECRGQALAAAAREEYELFHDLAWRALQKGPKNDATLMTLVARAQSLSGRPHDALVMLHRLAALGVATDAAEHDDFRRVRSLPGWPDLQARTAELKAPRSEPSPSSPPAPGTPADAAPASPPAPATVRPATPSPPPEPAAAARLAAAPIVGEATDALRFTTDPFIPAGLAYDAVSGRFIVGDLGERKLSVIGERSQRMFTLVGAGSGGFGEIGGIAIDPREGDLWVATTSRDETAGALLHKLQLISGRPLFTVKLPAGAPPARLADIAVTPESAVLTLDALGGRVYRYNAGAGHTVSLELAATLDVHAPTSIAASSDLVVYVAHDGGISRLDLQSRGARLVKPGGSVNLADLSCIRWHRGALVGVQKTGDGKYRIVRLRLNGNGLTATGFAVLARDVAMRSPSSVVISGDTLYYLTTASDQSGTQEFLVRRISLR
jgi:hypothetical protein